MEKLEVADVAAERPLKERAQLMDLTTTISEQLDVADVAVEIAWGPKRFDWPY